MIKVIYVFMLFASLMFFTDSFGYPNDQASSYRVTKAIDTECDFDAEKFTINHYGNLMISDRLSILMDQSFDLNGDKVNDYLAILEPTGLKAIKSRNSKFIDKCLNGNFHNSYILVSLTSSSRGFVLRKDESLLKGLEYIIPSSIEPIGYNSYRLAFEFGQSGTGILYFDFVTDGDKSWVTQISEFGKGSISTTSRIFLNREIGITDANVNRLFNSVFMVPQKTYKVKSDKSFIYKQAQDIKKTSSYFIKSDQITPLELKNGKVKVLYGGKKYGWIRISDL